MLNEAAPDARRRHDFAQADTLVSAAHQLIALGRNVSESERLLSYLEAHDAGLGFGPDIAAARRELAGLLLRLSPAVAAPEAMAELSRSADLPELAGRSADLHHELSGLVQQQREAVAQLERDAVADRDRVVGAWDDSQRLLTLSNDDPLVGRYQRLLAQFTAARGDPAALQAARKDAAAFLASQREWRERLATQRQWQASFKAELPRPGGPGHGRGAGVGLSATWRCCHSAACGRFLAASGAVQQGPHHGRSHGGDGPLRAPGD